jgi:hypothetical protein
MLAGLAACGLFFAAEAHLLSFDLGFPLDDSWIHLQFARNLAAGDGLTYNPGEPVTGSTAPLWTALLALLFLLPGNVVVWTKLLGVALYLAGLAATWRLARELDLPPPLALFAAGLTAATSWLAWSALSGMEVPLFVLLSVGGMALHVAERRQPHRPPLSLGVLGLSVLARPEGALLLLLALADRLIHVRRGEAGELRLERPAGLPLAAGLGLAVCAVGGTAWVYWQVSGSLLPTTFAAKGSEVRRWLPEVRYLGVVLGLLFPTQPWMTVLAGAGVLRLVERLGTSRDRGLLPALWVLGLPLAYSLMSPLGPGLIAGNFGRYYFPLFPVVVVLGAAGLERAAQTLRPGLRWGGARVPLGVLAGVLLVWPTVTDLVAAAPRYAKNVADVQDSDVRMARFLAERLPPEAVLAVNDIGALKYFLPNRIVDLVGIASPEARRFVAERQAEGMEFQTAVIEFLAERRPDYLVIFPSWLPEVAADRRFPPVYDLPIPDNRTMGGDELVVLATPWTRYPLAEPPDAVRRPGDPLPVSRQGSPDGGERDLREGDLDEDPADGSGPR